MKVGCQMPFSDFTPPAYISEAGAIVEEIGFDSLWVPEHVVFFADYDSRYPYSGDGRLPGEPRSLLDPFSALTFVAATTQRIKLCTGVCLVPQRNPVYCAKQVADLDYLSNGRFEFGIGIGWLKEEFEALGVPWQGRAKRLTECLGVMQSLWQDDISNFTGELFQIQGAVQNPKPVQKPHPPLIFGGESDAALNRVATIGQGWYGFNLTPETFKRHLDKLDGLLEAAGRSRDELKIYLSPAAGADKPDDFRAFAAAGAEQIILPVMANDTKKLRSRASATLDMIQSAAA
jgi:probable F420-dependent oxidoreductase